MVLNHHVRKSLIIIIATCLIISVLIFNVVFGYYRGLEASRAQTVNEESSLMELDNIEKTSNSNLDDIIDTDDKSTADNEDINSSTSSASTGAQQKNQSTYTAPPASSQQPEPREQVAVCNEAMQSSYTSLYNSQVTAENVNWANQISQWQSDARARGIAFSGYVQGMINDNQPAHDARLAQIKAQYDVNLASINCL